MQRVFLNMRRLAEQEQADLNVLIPATWLQDCAAVCKKSGKRAQASTLSADAAIAWLRQEGYPEQHFDAIHHAIAAHSFSAGIPPQSLEAQVLQDADRLDALGAVGIARTMMLGGQFGSMLAHPDEPFPETRARDDKQYVVDHFYVKLLHLEKSFQTASGRHEAAGRTHTMRTYLNRLAEEMGHAAKTRLMKA